MDPEVVHQLVEMGFQLGAARKANRICGSAGLMAALDWLTNNPGDAGDPDDNDRPLGERSATAGGQVLGSASTSASTPRMR